MEETNEFRVTLRWRVGRAVGEFPVPVPRVSSCSPLEGCGGHWGLFQPAVTPPFPPAQAQACAGQAVPCRAPTSSHTDSTLQPQREPPPPSPTSAVQASSPQSLVLFWSQVHAPGGIGCLLVAGQDPAARVGCPIGPPGALRRVPSGRGHRALDDVRRQLCVRGPSPGPLAAAWSSGQYLCARPTRPPSSAVLSPRCGIRHFFFELCCRGHTSGPDAGTFSCLEETLGRSPWGEGGSVHALGEHRSGRPAAITAAGQMPLAVLSRSRVHLGSPRTPGIPGESLPFLPAGDPAGTCRGGTCRVMA